MSENSSPTNKKYEWNTNKVTFNQRSKAQAYKQPAFRTYQMNNTFISLDQAFIYVGDNSKYQKRVIQILSIFWILYSFLTMGLPILFMQPQMLCENHGHLQICDEHTACNNPQNLIFYDEKKVTTLAQDFYLICDRRWLIGLAGSLYFTGLAFITLLGSVIAGIIFPIIADMYGRKKTLVLTSVLGGISTLACGISPDIEIFMICLFISGTCLNGFETITLVYVSEISAIRFRNWSGVTLYASWAFAQIIFTPISYYFTNWRFLMITVMGIPMIFSSFLIYHYLDESPRYLVIKQNFQQAKEILNKIAVFNLRPEFEFRLNEEMDILNAKVYNFQNENQHNLLDSSEEQSLLKRNAANILEINQKIVQTTLGYYDILIKKEIRNLLVLLMYIWFLRYVVYFGIQFSVQEVSQVDIHANFLILAFAELIGSVIAAPLKLKYFRKTIFNSCLYSIVICYFLKMLVEKNIDCTYDCLLFMNDFNIILSMILKFSVTIYTVTLLSYTPEVLPTNIRSSGYGLCMAFGKLGNAKIIDETYRFFICMEIILLSHYSCLKFQQVVYQFHFL